MVFPLQIQQVNQKCNSDNGATCASVMIVKFYGKGCIVLDAAQQDEDGKNVLCYVYSATLR